MRIAFLSTPEFGVPVLRALVAAGHEIVGVFTQPDRARGRGGKLSPCPVRAEALSLGLSCFAFEKIRRREGVEAMRALAPDVMITAAFGQILTQRLLDIPRFGCLNIHASLLPKYRGAAPIQWAIINGEKTTGVTIMQTDAGIDTGDMLMREETPIGGSETAGELFERLSHIGARLITECLEKFENGIERVKQDETQATHYPMIQKEDAEIDFRAGARQICDFVRGMNPAPVAWARLNGEVLKVYSATPFEAHGECGVVLPQMSKLVVGCGDRAVSLEEIQASGKRRMRAEDYLRGHAIAAGSCFSMAERYEGYDGCRSGKKSDA